MTMHTLHVFSASQDGCPRVNLYEFVRNTQCGPEVLGLIFLKIEDI